MYDHYRVLRAVPSFAFVRLTVDRCANHVAMVPCALLAGLCALQVGRLYHIRDNGFKAKLSLDFLGGFAMHVVVHSFALMLLQHQARRSKENLRAAPRSQDESFDSMRYEDAAAHTPCSWFSAN